MRLNPRVNIGKKLSKWLDDEFLVAGNTTPFKIVLWAGDEEKETTISGNDIFYTLYHDYGNFHVYSAESLVDFMFDWNRFVRIHTHDFERMYTALTAIYNPIENYDKNSTITNNGSTGANPENPFVTRTYQVADDTVNNTGDSAFIPQNKVATEGKTDTSNTMTEHTHGNIGVTKSTELLGDTFRYSEEYLNLFKRIVHDCVNTCTYMVE